MFHRSRALTFGALLSAPVVVGALVLAAPAALASGGGSTGHDGRHGDVTYVSAHGKDSAHCGSWRAPCRTIGQGVTNASPGSTVRVGRGKYAEQVTVTKRLTLSAKHATIDATGKDNGILLTGGASGSTVRGFTVVNATGEGILAVHLSHLVIRDNVVEHNDRGATEPNGGGYAQCQAQGNVPGDCGEALHLMSVWDSTVRGNQVEHNVGGILLTDELGPNHGNLVVGNNSSYNVDDCGITLPSHNPMATTDPTKGGVYDNTVAYNTINHNGLVSGGGSGVIIAAAGPGMASYDNTVIGNRISGNGESGVTIHSHTPDQNVNGNRIVNNWIGTNNTAGDADAGDTLTTGVLVFSAVVPVTGTTISGNHISHNHFGIWLTANVATSGIHHNHFSDVTVDLHVAP